MNQKEFDKILQARIQEIQNVLGSKAKEYAHKGDRLHNFKVAAQIDKETSEQALWGMLKKHLVCIMDMKDGNLEISEAMVNEKIGDAINYLILLEALMKEEKMNNGAYYFRGLYIPERMLHSIRNWIDHAVVPGQFLTAIIENNLKEAVGYADDENFRNISAYVGYFYNEAPMACWGSPENMKQWIADKKGS